MSDADVQQRIARLSPEKRALLERRLMGGQRAASYQPIPVRASRGRFPMSFAQQRLWVLDQIDPAGSLSYHLPRALRITGALDVEALQRTLDAIVLRHEVLRTTFAYAGDTPVQVINQPRRVEMPIVDLSQGGRAHRESELKRLLVDKSRLRFDLSKDLMLRATLFKLADDDHVLLSVTHHIASDAWSRGVFFGEMSSLYNAFTSGQASQLPDLPIQYGDFACWQRERLQGETLNAQLDYWKRQLADMPALLELPTDRSRPPAMTFRGARLAFTISADHCEQLKALSRRHKATLFMTLLAAFQTLLYRYTGQHDIAVGSPIANRGRVEIEPLIGLLLNTLVLRTDLSGNPSFSDLLDRVRGVALDGYANQDIPFERLVEELRPERDLSRNPLFQVMFILQNAPRQDLELSGLAVAPVEVEADTAQFDLRMTIQESDGGLSASLEYSTDLFDDATITRMIGHFQSLLSSIVADPDQPISELPLLTEGERHQALVLWNETASDYPDGLCIHELVEAQAERTPDAIAIVHGDDRLTYRELDERASDLGRRLSAAGVGRETLVGIYTRRSTGTIEAILGTLKAGGAYVPLDPTYPRERLEFMIEDSQVHVLLTQRDLFEELPNAGRRVICLDAVEEEGTGGATPLPEKQIDQDGLAYVIYTSGSTGKPKGVTVSHRAVLNTLYWLRDAFDVGPDDVVAQKTATSFTDSVWELFLPLISGATLAILDDSVVKDPDLLRAGLENHGVTITQFVPPQMAAFLEALRLRGEADPLPRLRWVFNGGEALPAAIARDWYTLFRRAKIANIYGMTESAIYATSYILESRPDDGQTSIPIGKPIANARVYVLDAHGQPCPANVPGEICVGGVGLSHGYLNRPELTAEKFVPDPYDDRPGARFYRTGDLGRFLADGTIEYIGRTDSQVKVRGFRVELGEVEAALRQHPTVREAVAIAQDDSSGSKRLSAYVVLREPEAAHSADLREFLEATLPGYMVPSGLMILDALPLTPNGKVDRRALPDAHKCDDVEHEYVAPRDDLEQQLAGIWERVLEVPRVGVADNFFDLGGHSLLGARLFAQIEKKMGAKLPLATLFHSPSVAQLASLLRSDGSVLSHSSLVPIHPDGAKPPFFLVHGADGYILGFRDLTPHLGEDQPFYGLEAQDCAGGQESFTSFEEMASHYVREIRTAQPEGPYFLGGFCMGGKIALEMAQQLVAQGQEVALLVLMDTPRTDRLNPSDKAIRRAQRFIYLVKRTLLLSKKLWGPPARGGTKHFGEMLDQNRFLRHIHVRRVHYRASRKYIPKVYPGRISAIVSEQPVIYSRDDRLAWDDIAADGLEVYRMPGREEDMLREPNVSALARHVRTCMEQAQAAVGVKQT